MLLFKSGSQKTKLWKTDKSWNWQKAALTGRLKQLGILPSRTQPTYTPDSWRQDKQQARVEIRQHSQRFNQEEWQTLHSEWQNTSVKIELLGFIIRQEWQRNNWEYLGSGIKADCTKGTCGSDEMLCVNVGSHSWTWTRVSEATRTDSAI